MQEEKEIRDLVQQVAEGHKNSKAAKERIQKFKQSIGKASLFHITCDAMASSPWFPFHSHQCHLHFTVKEVSEQRQELLRQALEEAQAELSRKFEIIREIRAIQSLPHIRVRNFDDTEVGEGRHGCHNI